MGMNKESEERVKYLGALEKKVRRLLLRDENEKAIELLYEIIEGYWEVGEDNRAKALEEKLKLFLIERDVKLENIAGVMTTKEESEDKVLFYIESLEKKIKRRLLQGKTAMAIEDLRYIIKELRRFEKFEKAKLLEDTLNQFILELYPKEDEKGPLEKIVATPQSPGIEIREPLAPENQNMNTELELTVSKEPISPPIQSSPSTLTNKHNQKTSQIARSFQTQPQPIQSPPTESGERPRRTIKDEPFSEEELLVKKLLDIKNILAEPKKREEIN